jgi:hypothetical protein
MKIKLRQMPTGDLLVMDQDAKDTVRGIFINNCIGDFSGVYTRPLSEQEKMRLHDRNNMYPCVEFSSTPPLTERQKLAMEYGLKVIAEEDVRRHAVRDVEKARKVVEQINVDGTNRIFAAQESIKKAAKAIVDLLDKEERDGLRSVNAAVDEFPSAPIKPPAKGNCGNGYCGICFPRGNGG